MQFGDAYTSGSSMMPQKRNPDVLELARGSSARMLGNLTTLVATLKGLPTSYNKDLQDDKRVLFDAIDTLLLVLPAVSGALAECRFRPERMRAALASTMMATVRPRMPRFGPSGPPEPPPSAPPNGSGNPC